jgi:hypothetical protein
MSDTDSSADAAPEIDWSTAEVNDGELTVEFAGVVPKGWISRLNALLERLGHTGSEQWGAIKVAKGRVRVGGLAEGAEPDLHHLLESAVLQANADLVSSDADDATDEESPEQVRDGRMAAAFRAFAAGD